MDTLIGKTLSHYRIVQLIGMGGMGAVYRAHDEHLDRDVALKVLPAGVLADDAGRKRFRREAIALSKLTHPHIAVVHDFDNQEGVDFLVMELVLGETLSKRLSSGPLSEREVGRLGAQLAEGLAAAHKKGTLHRDIKPANLQITSDGNLKILDFGLARLGQTSTDATTESLTVEGHAAGTLPYMSPEQLRGDRIDERADLFAAGATLYEMATGKRAFPHPSTPLLIDAILNQPVAPPRGVSGDLERIVLKCLEKNPEDRYQSARELAVDLRHVASASAAIAAAVQRRNKGGPLGTALKRGGVVAVAGGAVLVAIAIALNLGGLRERLLGPAARVNQSLAVMPLVNLSRIADQDYFVDGMTEELIGALSQIGSLRVIARSSVMALKGTKDSPSRIGKRLGVANLIEGSVSRSGNRVKVSAELIGAPHEQVLWAKSYERDIRDVFALQADVAQAIAGEIRVRLTTSERARLMNRKLVSAAAHEAYLQGRFAISKRDSTAMHRGMKYLLESVRIDSTYALAWAGIAFGQYAMSNLYVSPTVAMPRARDAAERALSLDPDLAEAHLWRGVVLSFFDWDWAAGDREFSRATELNPSLADVGTFYGNSLMYQGKLEEAIHQFERSRQLDPIGDYIGGMSSFCLYFMGRYAEAAADFEHRLQIDPNLPDMHCWLGLCYLRQGKGDAALAELRKGAALTDHAWPVAQLGYALGALGHGEEANRVLSQLLRPPAGVAAHPYGIALVYAGLGDRRHAFEWLEKAYADRSEDLPAIHVDPAWNTMRADPRFQSLLQRMNLSS
jgi:serine/threonine-protein kinase